MKKPEGYLFYIILGAPISLTIVATKDIPNSGLYVFAAGFIMTIFCMFYYLDVNLKKDEPSMIATKLFASIGFILLSMFILAIPTVMLILGTPS